MSVSRPMAVKSRFVKAMYEGIEAKRVMTLATSGLGYYILDQPNTNTVVVAFRIANKTPLRCQELSEFELDRVLDLEDKRMGRR